MDTIIKNIENFAASADESTRRALAGTLRDLAVTLETPNDTLQRVVYQPFELMVAQIALDLGLFKLLVADEKPQTTEALAAKTGADALFLDRILRCLASFRLIKEDGEQQYSASNVTRALTRPGYDDGIWFHFYMYNKVLIAAPRELKRNKYRNPDGPTHTAFQTAFDTEMPAFLWLQRNQEYLRHFVQFMSNYHEGKPSWTTQVDIEAKCKDCDAETPVFVDVGGGLGFQAVEFQKAASTIKGRLIVQDLKETLEQAPEHPGIEKMEHDFFKPQPVTGARFYFLRNIIHDYSDERATEILTNLKDALAEDSVILINDLVVPNVGADRQAAQQDIAMMITLGAMERTEKQWRALIDGVGLRIKSIKTYGLLMGDSIIEVVQE